MFCCERLFTLSETPLRVPSAQNRDRDTRSEVPESVLCVAHALEMKRPVHAWRLLLNFNAGRSVGWEGAGRTCPEHGKELVVSRFKPQR